jgi:hypothetical protein
MMYIYLAKGWICLTTEEASPLEQCFPWGTKGSTNFIPSTSITSLRAYTVHEIEVQVYEDYLPVSMHPACMNDNCSQFPLFLFYRLLLFRVRLEA